ncbi:MAG: hypothetical protein O2857_18920 [Planctomycetota bacterium]|nr:hypothetical protein [Planctomycetota bacterium]
MTEPLQPPSQLDSRLRAVWRRGQTLHVTSGMLAFCRWGILLFLIGMAADWMTYLPAPGRIGILVTLLAVSVYKAWSCGWRHAGTFNATNTALQIEEHHGGLESLLVTAVQFRDARPGSGGSESLREVTCLRAEEAVGPLKPEEIVPYHGLRRPVTVALILALIIVGFAVVNGPFLAAGLARLFPPWLAINYPTRTLIDRRDGDRIVKEGASIRLHAEVSGVIPAGAKLTLRTGKGKPREHTLAIDEGVCEYNIESVFRSFEYRISAGDARSSWHSVRAIPSPRIEQAEVSLEFPSYTSRPVETVEALTLTVPEGTRIKWKLSLDRAVSQAEFRPAGESALPLEISPDGRSVTMQQVAAESRAYSFGWVGKEHGFSFSSPRHYLQVAPDQAPSVELTSPKSNLYATLERKLDLAFRARDDHGFGEAVIAYRVNKTGEERVPLPAPALSDGSEQRIDWDYREALPDLAVGDTVSFAVELADRYPGPKGPHRARSDARRVQFLSKEDYLKQIARQKRRLLSQIRTIYREERGVHDLVRRLDPSDDVFIQTCQLEAVRQDLIRERMNVVQNRIRHLIEELAANNVLEEAETKALDHLSSDLRTIAEEHVGRAASLLRELAAVARGAESVRNPVPAVHMVNSAARELGLVVLQLGFQEAADVMARELHATAQTQATLRLQTIVQGSAAGGKEELATAQTRLAGWCARLLAATPRNRESTSTDALVAFNLSRLVNKLLSSGAVARMHEAADRISKAEPEKAARLQAEVIVALLHAEFRLRLGAEHEALYKARDLFTAQVAGQKKLRVESSKLTREQFDKNRTVIAQSQAALHRQLHLLLMPAVPSPRPRLFDAVPPPPPPVGDLLASAETALEAALGHIKAGDREAAASQQRKAENAFEALAEIAGKRMEAMTEVGRMNGLVTDAGKQASKIVMLEERLLVLLEKTEDIAADDNASAASLARQNQSLADDAERFRMNIVHGNESQATLREDDLPLLGCLSRMVRAMNDATPLLKDNNPNPAIALQEKALDSLEEAGSLIEELTATRADFAGALENTMNALTPSPLLAEIEAEQRDMAAITKKAKPDDLPGLVIPQKNLIHAVDAVLNSLDALAHKIESGTVMLFAKDDMDSAAAGLQTGDVEEALDAQSFVVESLQEFRAKIDNLTPQYRYVLEVSEFLYELAPESARIRTGMRQLRENVEAAPDAGALKSKAEEFGSQLQKLTGVQRFAVTARQLSEAMGALKAGDHSAAETQLDQAREALIADTAEMQTLMKNLAYLIAPPPGLGAIKAPSPEVKLTLDVLGLAANQKDLSRKTGTATPEQLAGLASQQRKLESQCAAFIPASESHPNLVAAHRHLSDAAAKLEASDRAAAISSQHEAGEVLRYFILEYALKYVDVPPPAPPEEGAPSDDAALEEGELHLIMPGALTGTKPRGGRVEWEVLGRRHRAALNENFARELPLEYRAILKDYYERLVK